MAGIDAKALVEILEQSLAGYWDWNIPTGEEFLSPSFKKMFGYEDHEIPNRADAWQSLVFPEDLPSILETFRRHIETRGAVPFRNEVRYRHKNGSTVWVICTGKVIEWTGDGQPVRMVGCHIDITDRKKNEELLRQQNTETGRILSLYQDLVDTSQDLIWQCDSEGRYTFLNPAWKDVLGYEPAEMIGKRFTEFQKPEQAEKDTAIFSRLMKGMTLKGHETVHLRKDGSEASLVFNAKQILGPQGEIIGTRGTAYDITERKKTEERLRLYLHTINTAPICVYWLDREGRFVYVNESGGRELGYTQDELLSLRISHINPKATAERWNEIWESIKSRKNLTLESVHRRRDGTEFPVELTSFYLVFGDKEYITGFASDITERKRIETVLRRSEYFFKESQRAAKTGSYQADFVADRWESSEILDEIFGIDGTYDRTVPGWIALIHPEDREMMTRYLQEEVIGQHCPFNKEYRIVRKNDGETRWVHGLGSVGLDESGRAVSLIGTIRDITEHKRMEESLHTMQKLESLGDLAGGIAHDFNNILAILMGNISLALQSVDDRNSREALESSLAAVNRAKDLSRQLITFAKGGAPITSVGPIEPILRESVRFALSGSNATCRFELKDSLPNCSIDPNQIGQVIQNVVINATQAMPKGGEILISVIDTRIDTAGNPDLKPGRYIRISVEDQGTGIPPDILPRIFDPYFTTKSTGSGLGLAISFSIVKKHGGIIRAESVLGKGSTIHILLPAVDDPANQSPLLFGHPIRGSGRILVMDDEPAILKSYSAGLIKAGYSVETAAKGEEALEIFHACLREGRPLDAAILDLTIPGGMGGIQCAGEIRKTDTRIPLIVASGYSEDPVFSDPAHYGFTAGIPKPFEFNDLLYLLSRVIPARKTDP